MAVRRNSINPFLRYIQYRSDYRVHHNAGDEVPKHSRVENAKHNDSQQAKDKTGDYYLLSKWARDLAASAFRGGLAYVLGPILLGIRYFPGAPNFIDFNNFLTKDHAHDARA